MGELLSPRQLVYRVNRGAEAAVNAARLFVQNLEVNQVFVKLDFTNAFNTLQRDRMLLAVEEMVPKILPLVHSPYASPSRLYLGDRTVISAERVQQGDPLCPLLFCLSIHHMKTQLASDFKVFHLDDRSLGGSCEDVLDDLEMVGAMASDLGLQLNTSKSEVVCHDSSTVARFLASFPGLSVTATESARFLGSPLSECMDEAILEKVGPLKVLESRISYLQVQDALLLLRHSLAMLRLLYLLRTAPCFHSPKLALFNETLCWI